MPSKLALYFDTLMAYFNSHNFDRPLLERNYPQCIGAVCVCWLFSIQPTAELVYLLAQQKHRSRAHVVATTLITATPSKEDIAALLRRKEKAISVFFLFSARKTYIYTILVEDLEILEKVKREVKITRRLLKSLHFWLKQKGGPFEVKKILFGPKLLFLGREHFLTLVPTLNFEF